jgi:hypothetical protein
LTAIAVAAHALTAHTFTAPLNRGAATAQEVAPVARLHRQPRLLVLLQSVPHRRAQHRPRRPALLRHRTAPLRRSTLLRHRPASLRRSALPFAARFRSAILGAPALLVAELGAALLESLLQLLQSLLRRLEAGAQLGPRQLLAAARAFALLGRHHREQESEDEQ